VEIAGFAIPSESPLFISILAVHIPLGLSAVVAGAAAMLREKGRGAHSSLGSIYFWSLAALFATSTALAAMRWSEDYHLVALGALAFAAALIGREARRHRWQTAIDLHIIGMGISYVAMLTAFYVDNGKNLPIWRDLPSMSYWIVPSAVGFPVMIWALVRNLRTEIQAQRTAL
jgi:uncharacterized membrane protein